jgi:integrative and conjugative element protein (TIGR02256 family)
VSNKKLNEELSFKIEPEGTLYLTKKVLRKLVSFRQEKSTKKEAGGILLGKQFENNPDIIINDITTPLKGDKRSRHQFYRSISHHKKAVEYWKKSNGTCLYLGLWHSHPEMVPNPSSVDFNDWENALKHGKYEGDSLLFIIVGISEIRCWQGKTNSKNNTKKNCDFKLIKNYDE